MEALKRAVIRVAATPDGRLQELPFLQRSLLLPLLSFASSLFRFSLALRHRLYRFGLLPRHRQSLKPLILCPRVVLARAIAARWSRALFLPTAVAASIFERHGYMKFEHTLYSEKLSNPHKFGSTSENGKVGVAILDDGMQVSDGQLKIIKSKIHTVDACHVVFFTRLAPSHFFEVKNQCSTLPLNVVLNRVVLCVSAIGFPNAFVQAVGKVIGPLLVDRLDFGDHHSIQLN
ncbi:hypothetical protein BHE74_00056191, partial [Ensete ventricosum]